MRVRLMVICIAAGLFLPKLVEGQQSDPPVRLQLSVLISRFHYERGAEDRWRSTSALRLRAILRGRFFGEISYTTPFVSEGLVYCPGQETCPPEVVALDDKSKWFFSLLSGSIGIRHPAGRWVPYLGIGGGRLKTEDESLWGWIGYSGIERSLSTRWTMLFEYRVNRVDWPSEGISWNQEAGIGVAFTF